MQHHKNVLLISFQFRRLKRQAHFVPQKHYRIDCTIPSIWAVTPEHAIHKIKCGNHLTQHNKVPHSKVTLISFRFNGHTLGFRTPWATLPGKTIGNYSLLKNKKLFQCQLEAISYWWFIFCVDVLNFALSFLVPYHLFSFIYFLFICLFIYVFIYSFNFTYNILFLLYLFLIYLFLHQDYGARGTWATYGTLLLMSTCIK